MLGPLAAVAFLLAMASPLYAQEATPETKEVPTIFEGDVGPYRMVVQAIPYPPTQGALNLHATLHDAATGQYVSDAEVTVQAQRLLSSERARALLRTSAASPGSYSTELKLLEEGDWTFTFHVSGIQGQGSVEVTLDVAKQPASIAGWIAWGGMALALLLILALARRNAKRVKQALSR